MVTFELPLIVAVTKLADAFATFAWSCTTSAAAQLTLFNLAKL
jgi:hypothetical protein